MGKGSFIRNFEQNVRAITVKWFARQHVMDGHKETQNTLREMNLAW